MPTASSCDNPPRNPRPNARALLPFLMFVLFYAGLSVVAGSFDVVPMAVAFSVAAAAAIAMDRGRPLARRIDSFTRGMGDPNLMLMCLIFVFAGAFATVANAPAKTNMRHISIRFGSPMPRVNESILRASGRPRSIAIAAAPATENATAIGTTSKDPAAAESPA